MELKVIKVLVFVVLFFTAVTQGAIYIDGQLHSGDVLNIVDLSYNDTPILLTGDSVVNIYENQAAFEYDYAYIDLTESSVANIFYKDQYNDLGGGFMMYQPAIRFDIRAYDDSVANFINPEDWNVGLEYNIDNWLTPYQGLQVNRIDYPLFADRSTLWRSYSDVDPDGEHHILAPVIGELQLYDDAVMNFVPEPGTLLLLGIGFFISRKAGKR